MNRRKHPDKAPITGIASPVKQPTDFSSHTGSLGRGGNPLKTFSVPDPPLRQSSVPGTTPKHIGNCQHTGERVVVACWYYMVNASDSSLVYSLSVSVFKLSKNLLCSSTGQESICKLFDFLYCLFFLFTID